MFLVENSFCSVAAKLIVNVTLKLRITFKMHSTLPLIML
jgi:hypothetical protein